MKRRIISLFLAIALLAGVLPAGLLSASASDEAIAYPVEGGNIYFYEGTITDSDETVTRADIPAEINGIAVTQIGDWAFADRAKLAAVTIPDSVTVIGWNAFLNCAALTSVVIPDSVTTIDTQAFCCCAGLSSVTIGSGVTGIQGSAFFGCVGLTEIIIPGSVSFIGSNAFANCTNLENITLSGSLTEIGGSVFCGTAYYDNADNWNNGVLYLDNWLLEAKPGELSGNYEILPGTVGIAPYAFDWCEDLTWITIPDSVVAICHSAFVQCRKLTKVVIPGSVKTIGRYAFANCGNLAEVTIESGLEAIGIGAFQECESLTAITIPDSVTHIYWSAFTGCTKLAEISIPDSVTYIGTYAFYCTAYYNDENNWQNDVLYLDNWLLHTKFEEFSGDYDILPETRGIAGDAFIGCTGLTVVTIPDSVKYICDGAFEGCESLSAVVIPESVTEISDRVFANCTGLTSVTIPESVISIGASAFMNCESLNEITIPNSVVSIGDSAFSGCASLTSVTIGDSVTSIGEYAFGSCWDLVKVTVPESVSYIGTRAFVECSSLTSVYFMGDAPELGYGVFYPIYGWEDTHKPNVTLYYIEGKAGWTSPEWNGYKTATWTPNNQTDPDDTDKPDVPSVEFSDVSDSAWYKDAVEYAVTNGLMNGTGNNKFEPESPMTRAMLVTVLWRYAGEPAEGENIFSDVKDSEWYAKAVAWAAHNGIVGGVGNGRFDPDGKITREQMAAILYRYCNSNSISTASRADLTGFPDGKKVSSYATDALSWAVAEGLITGSKVGSKTYLDPQGNATRAQVATILMRFIENVIE